MSDPLGFLVSDVSRLLRRSFDEKARTIGVTRPQWRVLTLLARREGINQGGIADLLEVEPITLSRMIDRLQEAGLVERRADPNDRRAWQLFLTDKAAPIIAQLKDYAEELFVDVLDGFSEAEERQLNALLARIHQNLQNLSPRSDECGVRAHG
ncbi:MarR family winged helix-turn-helix transcriptional regulator [Sphingomonas colocasiae]|uniref:MarR family transcriptional regulator n=1 Tax=Sphingomonas colocasiae TaxID=1848973 RepID=A0ABS7PNN7_9SPHN|nr:MarR family transcriptional regulator [Sphingomonas colocasiae]MBY8822924.1 MarR family transcriptional regulator [Sphingomonas colocasiae]